MDRVRVKMSVTLVRFIVVFGVVEVPKGVHKLYGFRVLPQANSCQHEASLNERKRKNNSTQEPRKERGMMIE